jgi:hypothetical protein
LVVRKWRIFSRYKALLLHPNHGNRILSPLRLPIPPPPQSVALLLYHKGQRTPQRPLSPRRGEGAHVSPGLILLPHTRVPLENCGANRYLIGRAEHIPWRRMVRQKLRCTIMVRCSWKAISSSTMPPEKCSTCRVVPRSPCAVAGILTRNPFATARIRRMLSTRK